MLRKKAKVAMALAVSAAGLVCSTGCYEDDVYGYDGYNTGYDSYYEEDVYFDDPAYFFEWYRDSYYD